MLARVKPVSVARARVVRTDGRCETFYSAEAVPIWQLRRWLKLRKHLAFMRNEDKREGW